MAVFPTLHFIHNLQIGPISSSVTLQYTRTACQGQTLAYWAHLSDVNEIKCSEYAPGAVFTTLYFPCNLRIGPIS